jgi:hypothetical protein
MFTLIITLVAAGTFAAGTFAAGYLLRGLLAVAWERKHQRRPLAALSDHMVRGLADLAHNQQTSAAREADLALLDELRHRDQQFDHRAGPRITTSPPPVKSASPGPPPRPRKRP